MPQQQLRTDLQAIATYASQHEEENEHLRGFLKSLDSEAIDRLVQELNDTISPQIDCTACGNCCRSYMINVTPEEATDVSTHLNMALPAFKEKYLEESSEGNLIMKSIPCSFLTGNKCSVYKHRFDGCREFPHLHRPNFTGRLFGILMYYETCPIIFNVVEELKERLRFKGAARYKPQG